MLEPLFIAGCGSSSHIGRAGLRPISRRRWVSPAAVSRNGSPATPRKGWRGWPIVRRGRTTARPGYRIRSRRVWWSCAAVSVAGGTGSPPSSGYRPARCRGSSPDTRCRAWRCWTRSPANRSGAPRASDVRYERDRPGELVHMDVKKLGRIPAGGGWRRRAGHHQPPLTREQHRCRLRLHPLPHRRPLPTRILRDPARRERCHL